ncbi:hypothetical protein [Myxococcus eversor]|uniref:hypothetical protein n=1 Tax=Myxococcus eversor TaxID=2709661 RepID=UPI0013D7C62B|nr:hypothetical protein [Myxococcus eversor]
MSRPFNGLAVLLALVALGPPGSASARPMFWPNDRVALDDGSAVYGDTYTLDQIYSEVTYEKYSNCTGVCLSGMEAGDTDAHVFVDEGADPEASNTTEPPGVQVNPSTVDPAGQPFSKAFHKDSGFGNSLFGAGYTIDATLNGVPSTPSTGATLDAAAEGKIWAQAFGSGKQDLLRGRATASGHQSGAFNAAANVYVLGTQIYEKKLSVGTLTLVDEVLFNREFIKAQKSFNIMFITVTVKAALAGNAGVKVTASVGPTAAKLLATPKGGVYATASASASVFVVSVGVEGSLTLIEASLPVSGQLVSSGCSTLGWDLKSSFSVTTLSGKLKAFVKIKLFFIKKKASVTVASWNGNLTGSTTTWNLYNATGTAPMYFTCVGGAPVGGISTLNPVPSPPSGGGGTTTPPPGPGGGGGECLMATVAGEGLRPMPCL